VSRGARRRGAGAVHAAGSIRCGACRAETHAVRPYLQLESVDGEIGPYGCRRPPHRSSSSRRGRSPSAARLSTAHLFAPFGARGLNSAVEDAVGLAWRLALVGSGVADEALLDGYERERRAAALENLRVTAATMRFMAPPTPLHRLARDAILRGSLHSRALRRRVNSGRLAEPAVYGGDGVIGRPVPPHAPTEPLAHGFAVARIGGDAFLVRPDGYVAQRIDGAHEAAVDDYLGRLARSG
jgi:hypothetical protein